MSRPETLLERWLAPLLEPPEWLEIVGDLREEYAGTGTTGFRYGVALAATVLRVLCWRLFNGLGSDFRLAMRHLVGDPTFSVLAIVALALGAGVNTAVFTVADAVLFAPLPYPAGERLGVLSNEHTGSTTGGFGVSFENMRDVAERSASFDEIALFVDWQDVNYEVDGAAFRVPATFADQTYFETMGLRAGRGRLFEADENRLGAAAPVTVLSHGAWVRLFGADPGIIGRTLRLNGSPYEIVGVLDDDRGDLRYRWGESPTAFFLPLFALEQITEFELQASRGHRLLNAVMRLSDGVTFDQAGAELASISGRLAEEHPDDNEGWVYSLEPFRDAFFEPLQAPARVLLGGSLLVFVLVVVNLTSLLLIRAEGRVGEIVVRRALGARRWRLARLLCAESVTLSAVAAVLATFLAVALLSVVTGSGALELPPFTHLEVGWGRHLFTALSTLAAGLALGAVSTARLLGAVPGGGFRGTSNRASASRRSQRIGATLVAAEVGLAFIVLFAAGLLFGSFQALRSTGYGFNTDDLLLARVDLRFPERSAADLRQFAADAVERGRALPDVTDAFIWGPNRLGYGNDVEIIARADRWLAFPEERIEASQHHVHPGTLAKLGIRLLQGRDFTPADAGADGGDGEPILVPSVVIVSAAVASELWPGESAIGRRIEARPRSETYQAEVVGVVADSRHRTRLIDPDGPQRDIYYPFLAAPTDAMTLALRVADGADIEATADATRRILNELAPAAPVFELATMSAAMRDEESRHRFSAAVVGFYAGLALSLAAIGLYGVLAHRVRSQRRELGIRLALGASPRRLRRAVIGNGLVPVLLGVLTGAGASIPAGRAFAAFLYGVSVFDLTTYIAVPTVLLVVACLALYGPARRAARTSPAAVLREQ